jgi:hypothetical protein
MFRSAAITLALCFATVTAQAALLGRAALTPGGTDYQAIYDSDLNVTWLANANLAATNNFGVSGIAPAGYMSWETAQNWLSGLNATSYLGATNWRMPTTTQPDPNCSLQYNLGGGFPLQGHGYSCTGSEFGHLFYNELGGVVGINIGTIHNSNYELFNNIQLDLYWSGTTYVPDPSAAWAFYFTYGIQDANNKEHNFYDVWAVRDGDIGVVPIPAAVYLFGSALGLMGWMRRKSIA